MISSIQIWWNCALYSSRLKISLAGPCYDREVVITFLATVLLGELSKDILTTLIPSELGLLVYKDLTSRDTKYELGIWYFFYFVDFS